MSSSDDDIKTNSTEVTSTMDTASDTAAGAPRVKVISPGGTLSGPDRLVDDNLRHRTPFVSRHRQELDRIAGDASHSRAYPVPRHDDDDDLELRRRGRSWIMQDGFYDRLARGCGQVRHKTPNEWLEVFLPAWRWLRVYEYKSTLLKDLVAGLTVGVMIVPQSMSYAKLAGLPVEYGLYSALVPVYAYALFGSSRQLAVGPVAIISLLLSTGLAKIMANRGIDVESGNYLPQYTMLAVQTSFLVGVVYIAMGLARLGFVTIFLSHAVISGFTTGAAVIIGASQLKYIFGYNTERSDVIYEILYNLFINISEFNYKTFLMGTCSILLLVAFKWIGKHLPRFKFVRALGPLTVTVLGIVLVAIFQLQDKGIPVVGSIPQGLPAFTATEWTPIADFDQLMVLVIAIAIVGFMESIAIAKQLASKHKYEIDASQELIGLGMANFLGGMFQSYPVTGSFSRSAVNNESGAQSGISGLVTATLVGLVLLLLTSIFEILPLNILAAIVISGVLGLLDFDEAKYLWRVHKFDFSVWLIACFGTMFLGVEIGLAIAVAVSLLIVIYESAYPHTAVMGRLPGTTVYRNIKQYPEAERYDRIVIVRIDAPLYFANSMNVRDKIRKYRLAAEKEMAERNEEVKYLIIELTPVSHVDTTALHILEDMHINYNSRGQQLVFANPSLLVMERFVSSGFADRVGRQHFFSCSHDAVNWCLAELDVEAVSEHNSNHGHSPSSSVDLTADVDELKNGENV